MSWRRLIKLEFVQSYQIQVHRADCGAVINIADTDLLKLEQVREMRFE